MKHQLSNELCRRQAELSLERGDPRQALAWINTAYARTIGHGKSERYEQLGNKIAKEHNIERHWDFAEDSEAG